MLESDLRELFERQAASELPPAPPISIPAARRIGRTRLLRRRAAAFGSPVLAAGAVIAVVLASLYAAGPRKPAITPVIPVAPKLFNPLVPYAAVTWYPYRPTLVGVSDWHTALLLRASSRTPSESTDVALYPAGWCTLVSSKLSCGSTAAGTRTELTVTGRAPDVQGHAAYWTRYAGGNLVALRPPSGGGAKIVAFQYARRGWAVVESTGTPTDVLRVASSLQYGQTSRLRFPFRLTGLPKALSEVLFAAFTQAQGAHSTAAGALVLGSPGTRPGTTAHDALTLLASSRTETPPHCRTSSAAVHGPSGAASRPVSCPSSLINGYRVYLNSPPVAGKQTLFSPDADGLFVYENTIGPDAPLSPTEVFSRHLQLLGPDAATWTTTPSSNETVRLDHP